MARGTNHRRPEPRSIRIAALVAGTAAAAAALTLIEAGARRLPSVDPLHAGAFAVLLVAAAILVLDIRFRDQSMSLSLFESVLLPAIAIFSGPVVIVLTLIAHAIAEAWQRIPPLKAAFNVAQWSLAAIAGSTAFRLAGGTAAPSGRTFVALAAAATTMAVVNTVLFTTVVALAQRASPRRIVATHAPANLFSWTVNGLFGLLFFSAQAAHPAAVALFVVPLVALHIGLRGYAGAVAERRRLDGLHRAGQALSSPVNPLDGIEPFLDQVRICFGAAAAELMVAFDDGPRRYWSGPDKEAIGESLSAIVPVDGTTTGTLTVFDRVRIGDGDGDRAVLADMARAAGAALHKAILLKRVLDERRTLADIVQNTSDGICTITESGVLQTWNPAFETITGLPAASMIGRRSAGAVHLRREDGTPVSLDSWNDGSTLPPILRVASAGGEDRTIACAYTVVPAGDDREATLIVVGRDTTAAREVEQMREDFVAAVSHELRTPLTPIKGFAETLLRRGGSLDDAARDDIARTIGRQADRLERLITNLLEMTKVERGMRARPESTVDVAAVVEHTAGEFRTAHPGCPLEVRTEPAVARGDALWVEQVVANLLSNAVKYAPPSTPVRIVVESAGGEVTVEVADAGPGIAEADRERVFERFRRLDDDRTRATGGAGIGLYISRRLARMMEGDLIVADSDAGTRMILRLTNARRLAAVG